MKNTIYLIMFLGAALLMGACTKDDMLPAGQQPPITGSSTFTFSVSIPGEQVVNTRSEAIEPGIVENLYVLVFDSNGTFLSRTRAIAMPETGKYALTLQPANPDGSADENKRILHFVCNYDWSGFSDAGSIGKHETELIMALSVTGGKVAYWQRLELPIGITQASFPATVELLRNVAKISVVNNTMLYSANLYETEFALGDYADHGTVAPFDKKTLSFSENSAVESPDASFLPLSPEDFVPTGTLGYEYGTHYSYERENSTSHRPMYVIMKGRYNQDDKMYYYKIDIVKDGAETLYNITRNHHYVIDVNRVGGPGSATLEEAIAGPASNNLLYSVVLESYTSISDGKSVLEVEKTSKTFVEAGKEFTFSFSYIPDIATGAEDNGMVTIELEQDDMAPVVDRASVIITTTAGNAKYTGTTASSLPVHGTHMARLIFTATNNGVKLRRTIQLRLRQPSVFEDLSVTPYPVPSVGKAEVNLSFTIPDNLQNGSFPMEIFITSMALTPNPDYNSQDQLSLDYQKPGTYRYKYVARQAGKHTVHFKTTSSTTNEELMLESELFGITRMVLKN